HGNEGGAGGEPVAQVVHATGRLPVFRSAPALAGAPTGRYGAAAATARGSMKGWLAILVVSVFAAGCMVGPTYRRPPIAGTPAIKEAPPAGWKEAEPNEGNLRGRWWEIYNDPQLNDLASKVELSNQNVI